MEFNAIEKNSKMNKEFLTNDEIPFKARLFTFFFYLLRKKNINVFLCSIFLLIETIQLISYAFSDPHTSLWKVNDSTMYYLHLIISSTRIAPLMVFVNFNWYLVIYSCIIGYIFLYTLLLSMTLRFNQASSRLYQLCLVVTRYTTSIMTIFLLIPIAELLLVVLKCDSNYQVKFVSDTLDCWKGLHILYAFLSVIFTLLFFVLVIIFTIFYFNPFNSKKSATKIDTNADTFLYIIKMLAVIRFIALSNDWISIVVMLVSSLLNLKKAFESPTYNNFILECLISIRNASVFWTYFVLLICKILESGSFNAQVYLLLFGYPLIIIVAICYFKMKANSCLLTNSNFNEVNEFLLKVKYLKQLIDTFINKSKSTKSNKKNGFQKNEILLKGFVTIHEETCINQDCPLKLFLNNPGNYLVQKVSLLHFMNILFNTGIKKFPNSRIILLTFVQFNYEKKYNLNSAKTYLTKLEKSKNTLTEDYVIFSLKQHVSTNLNSNNISGEEDMMTVEESIELKFRRFKYYVETATKLYGEFWGLLATNLTNNLNLKKLFFVGTRLNEYLKDIDDLWENDLKNQKVDAESHGIIHLYAYFLREILKKKKQAEEVTKKINEEQHIENKKVETDKLDMDHIDTLLEKQDYVVYARANDKGDCTVIQSSNTMISLLGYTKQELLGKKIEVIMPGIYQAGHAHMLSEGIKEMRGGLVANKKRILSNDKRQILILPKSKVGYIIPLLARATVQNDDDFSNTYIIKAKLELKDTKSQYAFYVLAKDDFTVDSISSSALILGLSMDLLKKYVINLNYLIRTDSHEPMNLSEKFSEYEEEPKSVVWVFPDKIYPKNDVRGKNKEEITEKLIMESQFRLLHLFITKITFRDSPPIGYCLRFTEIDQKKLSVDPNSFLGDANRNLYFDMMRLNYVRAVKVAVKTKQEEHNVNSPSSPSNVVRYNSLKKGRKKRSKSIDIDNPQEEEDMVMKSELNILTKEKIQEFQGKNADEIKGYIVNLLFYGSDVTLIKKRSPREEYTAGKGITSMIAIGLDDFLSRTCKFSSMEKRKDQKKGDGTSTSSITTESTIDSGRDMSYYSDSPTSLRNIFNESSIWYIKLFSFIFFLALCGIISTEFSISFSMVQDVNQRIYYADKAYKILNGILYTKFFLTEAVLAQNSSYRNIDQRFQGNNTKYIMDMMREMSEYRQNISDTYAYFSNMTVTLTDDYYAYIQDTQIVIRTISNGLPLIEHQPFQTAISRIPTSIFYVSTVNDDYKRITLDDRNTYELIMNLMNGYFLAWRDLTLILIKDANSHTILDNRLVFIFGFSFFVSVFSVFGIWKLINKLIDDREKPVDLFLTIKKQKFEELKASSETFLNKLLNKFFGNEEAEEEAILDNQRLIKDDDIVISKFRSRNVYKQSIRFSSEYMFLLGKIIIFFVLVQAYMAFKYFYIDSAINDMNHFTDVFNITQYSQSDVVLSLNMAK